MIYRIIGTLTLALAASSCTGNPPAAPTPVGPVDQLHAILASAITAEQDSAFLAFESEHGAAVDEHLIAIALDPAADPLARANAVLRMGVRPVIAFDVYARTAVDPDPRVRGATMDAAGRLAIYSPRAALAILGRGLVDTEIGIQAKALQELRDRDLDMLRFYLGSEPPPELRAIAEQTLRQAEAMGAPIEPEPDGTLHRVSPAGVELVLRPDTAFPQWDQVVGTLTVVTPDGTRRVVADSVEAVATVIPAVVDPAGRYVAVETARRIEVHDLETGDVRVVERGIAPRPLPFTPDFFYFRELEQTPTREGTRVVYEMLRAPFEAGAPVPFDSIRVLARPERRGLLSPLRWARVRDSGTRFVLTTDGVERHELPLFLELGND